MKTHEVAKVLSALAQALRSAPNMPLEDFGKQKSSTEVSPSDVPTALSTLVALSDFDKQQWQSLIAEYNLPIEIRARDASRDILGKILKYLEQNPTARKNITNMAQNRRSDTSPELMRALQLILKT